MKKLFFIIFCFLLSHLTIAQITVDFTYSVDTITCDNPFPLFTGTDNSTSSAGEIVQWLWYDMVGPVFDTTSSPSFNIDPAVNSICLKVWDDQGNVDSLCEPIIYAFNNFQPVADAGFDQTINCAVSQVVLDGSGSDQGPDYAYQWNTANGIILSGANTLTPVVASAGVYELVLTNTSTGCTNQDEVIVIEDLQIPSIALFPNEFTICSSSLTLNFSNFPDGPDYVFNWSVEGAVGEIIDQSNPEMPIVGGPGVYALEIMDINNGCTDETYVTVHGDTAGHVTVGNVIISSPSCSGGTDGSIELEIYCGTPPYEYEWSDGYDQGPVYTSIPAGIYTVTVTDANDSIYIPVSIVVGNPAPLNSTVTGPGSICPGDDLCLDVVVSGGCAPYEYLWDNNGIDPNNCFPAPTSGDYCVTVTDCNGCSVVECFNLSLPNPIEITLEDYICTPLDGSGMGLIDISVMGGTPPYLYSWNNGEMTQDIQTSSPLDAYALTITDAVGCTEERLPPWHDPIILAETPDTSFCVGDQLTLSISAPNADSINWFSNNNEVFSCTNCEVTTVEILPSTDWFGIIAFAEGSCFDTAQIWVDPILDCVWPGDTDTNGVVNNFDLLPIGLAYDSVGPPRQLATIGWYGQEASDWPQFLDTVQVNYKHIDTDGNGLIDANDTLAITQNFGNTHNFLPGAEENFLDELPVSDALQVIPFYVQPDTLIPGATADLPVILGDMMNPVQDLYGMAFTINYDTSVVEFGSAKASFSTSWLGNDNQDMITLQQGHPQSGQVDLALTRIDGVNVSGNGQIATFTIIIQDDILLLQQQNNFGGGNNPVNAAFSIDDVYLINFEQELIPVEPQTTESIIASGPVNIEKPVLEKKVKIFPNPANDHLMVFSTPDVEIEKVVFYGFGGQVVRSLKWETIEGGQISIGTLPSGIYFIEIITSEGMVNKKLVVH